ncbi:hypothetical protein GLW00_07260 [Halobacillus litoralis]|uniref:DUF2198 domain-containing protein n=1 Tax=Halobacillus litoralis TaxID=45668 RepID=A0A845F9V7_9BACI|nr:hypothetical protein [Halobacillus litoralis]MYL70641.1 hypothetical protein [Halobacillus litoralis]
MSIIMYIGLFIAQIIGVTLAAIIFISIFSKSRKKGWIILSFLSALLVFQLIQGFNISIAMGTGMVIIDLFVIVAAFLTLKQKKL